ncbi:MAG: FAD binding domain-containing protein [Candidatus Riflebacteria bacterium]|nr:FAD binding domain-containing protein [Candidatus Riflebacteria bacterium]
MLKNIKNYYIPETIEKACALTAADNARNVVLAGGTHLGVIEDSSIDGLVDLKKLSLAGIKHSDNKICIGSMTTIQQILKNSQMKCSSGKLLIKCASRVGSTLLRNSITLGGNCTAVFPWSDFPPAMLVLNAQFVLSNGKSERIISADDFYKTRPTDVLKKGEILSEIRIPEGTKGSGISFHKVSKTKNDFSLITVAVTMKISSDSTVEDVKIALNAVTKKPSRCTAAEEMLKGKKADEKLFAEAACKAAEGIDFTSDFRASREYRQEVLPVYLRRCLTEAAEMAKGG